MSSKNKNLEGEFYFGQINRITFHNEENDWYVLKLELEDRKRIAAVGTILGLSLKEGDWIGFLGEEVYDKKWGKQLKIKRAPYIPPSPDNFFVKKTLELKGISYRILRSIENFALEEEISLFDLFQEEKDLSKVPGIDPYAASFIHNKWKEVVKIHCSLDFLSQIKIPSYKLQKIWEIFGDETEDILSKNPWGLLKINFSFEDADKIAKSSGLSFSSEKRWEAAIIKATDSSRSLGDLFASKKNVVNKSKKILKNYFDVDTFELIFKKLIEEKRLYVEGDCVYPPWCFLVEKVSSEELYTRLSKNKEFFLDSIYLDNLNPIEENCSLEEKARAAVRDWQKTSKDIILDEKQIEGAVNALIEPISIITGLPGTGKTTLLKAVVQILYDCGIEPHLMAPTGMAAKKLSEATGKDASTIHRALGAQAPVEGGEDKEVSYLGILSNDASLIPEDITKKWKHGSHNKHPARVILIDESSMLDQHLLWRILTSIKEDTRLVFIGDAAQLPSVGPGDVLHQLIQTNKIPCVHLSKIFRQDEASDIVKAAHRINSGIYPDSSRKGDFVFLKIREEKDILDVMDKMVERLWEKSTKSEELIIKSFQVISPRHGGTLGVTNLNAKLRNRINPPDSSKKEIRIKNAVVREGDRVTIVKNNYTLGVFNGDFGKVKKIDLSKREVMIKIYGSPPLLVTFSLKNISRWLRLAYAVTVHRAQGQEFDFVLLPLVNSFHYQLKRNLLYTAITRAKEKVVILGHESALERAVFTTEKNKRNTLLKKRLLNEFL